jgi:hypothetical protein
MIPESLEQIEGNCGVISVWLVLQYFHRSVDPNELILLCKHSTEVGTFTIALAVAIQKFDLPVSFHSEVDPDIQAVELDAYKEAKMLGIPLCPPQNIHEISEAIASGKKVIVFFDEANGEGHFSPVQSIDEQEILFEYSNEPSLSLTSFEVRRNTNGICRQSIVIG